MSKEKTVNTPSKSGGGVAVDRETRNVQRKDAANKRIPMHSSAMAHIPKGTTDRKNFHYRWCADYDKGKIERYQSAGYEFVNDPDTGERICRAGGDRLWLMRIPIEFWESDQLAKRGRQIQIQKQSLKKQAELADGAVPEYLPKEQNVL